MLGATLGVVLFAAIAWQLALSLRQGQLTLSRADLRFLGASVLLLIAANGAQALAWHRLLRAAGGDAGALVDIARWALSLPGKYIPGKVFHAVGRLALYRDRPTAKIATAYAAEMLLSLTAAACVAAVTLAGYGGELTARLPWLAAACAAVGLVVSLSAAFDRLAYRLTVRLGSAHRPLPIAKRDRLAAVALMVGSYLLLGLGLYLLVRAWDLQSALPLGVIVGALSLSGIAGVAAVVVPAGIGVREGVLIGLLAPIAGVPQAFFIALVARVWLTVGDALAAAAGALMLIHRRHRRDA